MKRAVAVSLLLAVMCASAFARTIHGVVHDASGARISHAQVRIKGDGGAATIADANGVFTLPDAPDAAVQVEVSAPGFATATHDIDASTDSVDLQLAPATVSEQMVVTSTRTALRATDDPSDVRLIDQRSIATNAGVTIDDALRQAVGFSLFRRSDSRVANPTSQGVSLRGIGASGASRAIVLQDGVPLNDPFGGWVQWERVPRLSVEQVEIVRGGLSDLYGGEALSGAVAMISRHSDTPTLSVELSGGSSLRPDGAIYAGTKLGAWEFSGSGEALRSPGYFVVSAAERGAIDTPASVDSNTGQVYIGRTLGAHAHAFFEGALFSEARNNGTTLQTNDTHLSNFAGGADLDEGDAGLFTLRLYTTGERYRQTFSSISADRNSESLTRTQMVPSASNGGSVQWQVTSRSRNIFVAGADWQLTSGVTHEVGFSAANATSTLAAGGDSRVLGLFVEDRLQLLPRVALTAALRGDLWSETEGFSNTHPLNGAGDTDIVYPGQHRHNVSPRAGINVRATEHVSFTAAGYGSFRAPTLNELYRGFRLGNVVTLANAALAPERMRGGEGGVAFDSRHTRLHATYFYAHIDDPITNATLSTTAALITRQRQNLGSTRSRGLEIEGEWNFNRIFLDAGYQFTDSIVLSNPNNPTIVGLLVPQVPRHQFTGQVRYQPSKRWAFALASRGDGRQFDDDQNQLPLPGFATLDAYAEHSFTSQLEAFVAVENLTGERYMVGRTPIPSYGPPLLARVGLRLTLGAR